MLLRMTTRLGRRLAVALALCFAATLAMTPNAQPARAAGNAYYVDCSASSNGSGTQSSPWNTLSSVNSHAAFGAGDQILLKRGTTCSGTLTPPGSGASGSPITLDAYGTGALPIISAGSNTSAVSLFNQQYWLIQHIETTGGSANGIYVTGDISGTLHNIHIVGVVVHDVNGTFINSKDHGLILVTPNGVGTNFDDVVIDGATAYNSTQWSGILIGGDEYNFTNRSTNVAIRNSTLHDVQGDGVVLWQVNNGTMEDNVSYNTGLLTTSPSGLTTPGSIWVYRCENCTLQFNEAYNSHSYSNNDGLNFDIDANSSNTVAQYNYGHDSDGPCLSLDNGDNGKTNSNDVFRYNVCANNSRNASNGQGDVYFYSVDGGSISNPLIYNNTFYWNPASNNGVLADYAAVDSGVSGAVFKNNLIYSTNPNLINATTKVALDNNLYWYTGTGSPKWIYGGTSYTSLSSYQSGSSQDAHALYADPKLNGAGTHSTGLPTSAYTLQSTSPAIDAGTNVCAGISGCAMGSRDFFGNSIPQGNGYDIGANESAYTSGGGTNLVSNPGFESGNFTSWGAYGTTSVVASNAHSGTYAAQTSGGGGGAEQTVYGLAANTTYTLTAWGRSSDGSSQVSMGVKNYGGTELYQSTNSTSYSQLSLHFTTGATNTSAVIYLYGLTGTGTVYADDFSLTAGGGPTITTVDDSVQGSGTNQFNYVGSGWGHCTLSSCGTDVAYNNSNSWDAITNDYVTLAFTGTQIAYYAVKASSHGIVAVSVDGGTESSIDLYATTRQGNVLVWTSPTLSAGTHTFKVRVTGTKNASSTNTYATIDRVDITS